ncbi:prepilin-type N-terminal cleavage/methylation domain-containing protein [Candidatus Sumerlaeota bacterium]|nr:prepilin-type N-terminal cleavage/methylation domain-containing protein [Candidatus Sumerlaeota bacterium]
MKRRQAFTLIELLIVVLIIAILAAIAVPNFLEFQTRAKISRVKADLRAIATALEAYYGDNDTYYAELDPRVTYWAFWLRPLTTPVAYMSSVPDIDPFGSHKYMGDYREGYLEVGMGKAGEYTSIDNLPSGTTFRFSADTWIVSSVGPDKDDNTAPGTPNLRTGLYPWEYLTNSDRDAVINIIYDPTNGTVSGGDIMRFGGSIPGFSEAHQTWAKAVSQ